MDIKRALDLMALLVFNMIIFFVPWESILTGKINTSELVVFGYTFGSGVLLLVIGKELFDKMDL